MIKNLAPSDMPRNLQPLVILSIRGNHHLLARDL
jgi:hypothetical protein